LGKKPERGIDPMECVAIGAAIQGGVLSGEISNIVLLDVTPLSLGLETLGGVYTKIIDRNTTIPVKQRQMFSTATDSQPAVTVHVLQGERAMAKNNISLGQFDLTGIPPAPRGVPQIEVTFDINADGVLNANAKDIGTGKQMGIKITASTKLSQTEKDRMIREAEQFGEQDKRAKEEAEMRNTADSLIYTSEKTFSEIGDKLPPEKKSQIQESIQGLKDGIKGGGLAEISAKVEELKRLLEEAGKTIYEQAASQNAQQQQASQEVPPAGEEQGKKTVEADYKVVA
jgi:molecular chaperone DnaK